MGIRQEFFSLGEILLSKFKKEFRKGVENGSHPSTEQLQPVISSHFWGCCWVTAGWQPCNPSWDRSFPKQRRKRGSRRRGKKKMKKKQKEEKRGKTAKETWRGGNGSGFREAGRDTSLNWVLAEPGLRLKGKEKAFSEDLGFSAASHLPPRLSECPPGEEVSNNHLAGNPSVGA